MRWADERYVRLYTRDTIDWNALGWEAQALFVFILRKVDRAGLLELGRQGLRGLAALVGMPLDVVERALPLLLEDRCVEQRGSTVVIPNFIEAQESPQSDAQRKRNQRENDLARALLEERALSVTNRDESSQNVTKGHTASHAVTSSHVVSPHAVPCCAEPTEPTEPANPPNPPDAGVGVESDLLLEFRRRLASGLCLMKDFPIASGDGETIRMVRGELEGELSRVDFEQAMATCLAAAKDAKAREKRWPSSLRYFVPVLNRLPRRTAKLREVERMNPDGSFTWAGGGA